MEIENQNQNIQQTQKTITCLECNSDCCNEISVHLDEPKTKDDFDYIKWLVSHENVFVYLDNEDEWLIEFQTKCKFLDEKKLCSNYVNRSDICKEFSHESCIHNGGDSYYKILFSNPIQVDIYLEKNNLNALI